MANRPKAAREKRSDPPKRQNAQGDHEGSAHSPEEFDVMNPQKQGRGDEQGGKKPVRQPDTSPDSR